MSVNQLPTSLIGLVILCAAVVLAAWPEPGPASLAPVTRAARSVRVGEVTAADGDRDLRLPGVTRASRRATLAFSLPARITERPVEVGDTVHAGQVVARLDDREYRLAETAAASAVAELDARWAQATRDAERAERLAAARAATTEEVEQVQAAATALGAAREVAVARLSESRRLLRETALVAPFDGTVTAVHLEAGEWAGPGAPVVDLSGSGALEVEVEAPENVRAGITQGAAVVVELPFLGRRVSGRVSSVAIAATGRGGLFPVEVALDPGQGLVAGLAAEVVLPIRAPAELTVPLAAVVDPGSSRPSVFKIVEGRARRVAVIPGRVVGDRLTVTGELASGDVVAVAGHTALADDDAVEVF